MWLEVCEIFASVFVPPGLYHKKFNFVYLRSVVFSSLVQDFAFFKIPDNHGAIIGRGCHIPVAFTHLYVNNHVRMSVEGALEKQGFLVPDFDYSVINYINLLNKLNLPIVCSCYNNFIFHIEFAIVNRSWVSFSKICMTEDCLHPSELLALTVQYFIFSILEFWVPLELLGFLIIRILN